MMKKICTGRGADDVRGGSVCQGRDCNVFTGRQGNMRRRDANERADSCQECEYQREKTRTEIRAAQADTAARNDTESGDQRDHGGCDAGT